MVQIIVLKGVIIIGRHVGEWDHVTLSDPNTIKGLLRFRYRYDMLLDGSVNRHGLDSNVDLCNMCDDLICLYADLDSLIEKANFNEYQNEILNFYVFGYIEKDIADVKGVEMQTINRMIDNMCNVLCKINSENWKLNYAYWNKVKVSCDFKKCSKCGEFLPMKEEYFRSRVDGYGDGFYNKCRKCENKGQIM